MTERGTFNYRSYPTLRAYIERIGAEELDRAGQHAVCLAKGEHDMTTLKEFLAGEPLQYNGFKKKCVATYRAGIGVLVEDRRGRDLGTADVTERDEIARLYWNLTRELRT